MWWKVIESLSSCWRCDYGSTTKVDVYVVESEDKAAAVRLLQIQTPGCFLIELKTTCRHQISIEPLQVNITEMKRMHTFPPSLSFSFNRSKGKSRHHLSWWLSQTLVLMLWWGVPVCGYAPTRTVLTVPLHLIYSHKCFKNANCVWILTTRSHLDSSHISSRVFDSGDELVYRRLSLGDRFKLVTDGFLLHHFIVK